MGRNAPAKNALALSDSRRSSPFGPISVPLHCSRSVDSFSKPFTMSTRPLPTPLRNFHEMFWISRIPLHPTNWRTKPMQKIAFGCFFILSCCLLHGMATARVGSLRKCCRNTSHVSCGPDRTARQPYFKDSDTAAAYSHLLLALVAQRSALGEDHPSTQDTRLVMLSLLPLQ